jgi:AP-3 complex subunit mu
MESLFIINSSGDVFLEKHWRSVISKSICDYFLEKLKVSNASLRYKLNLKNTLHVNMLYLKQFQDVPPVIPTSFQSTNIVSIQRCGVYFLTVCKSEIRKQNLIHFFF